MTPSRIACIALVALISAGAAPAAPSAAAQAGSYGQLPGVWDARTDDGAFKFVFEFSVEDGRLVGKYTGQSGSVPMKDLAFKDGVLTFSVDLSGMAIDFTASVVEDHMTGTLSLQFGEAAFAGTRRKGA
ncbi:MAG: hypothetical protein R6X21_03505 [Candidatus Aminicenantes bacterium]